MIKLENINLHYGSSQILHNVNMEIQEGKITTLMGSNGVGKTSLLKMSVSYTHLTLPTTPYV